MRVKLFYTVDEEEILEATADILGLARKDVQQIIDLFNAAQEELRVEDASPGQVVNINKVLEMLGELRLALLNVDTRASEVEGMILGYEDHKRSPDVLDVETAPEESA